MSHVENEKEVFGNEKDIASSSVDQVGVPEATYGDAIPIFKDTYRHLKPRHVQLIAISGAIGTGLYVSLQSQSRAAADD